MLAMIYELQSSDDVIPDARDSARAGTQELQALVCGAPGFPLSALRAPAGMTVVYVQVDEVHFAKCFATSA